MALELLLNCFAKPEGRSSPPPPPPEPPNLSYETLLMQDYRTISTIIRLLEESDLFADVSEEEARAIIHHEGEEEHKLAEAIQISIKKNILPSWRKGEVGDDDDDNDVIVDGGEEFAPSYMEIDVIGKTPDAVAEIILSDMEEAAAAKGGVVVLCGLPGAGKGSTLAALKSRLPTAIMWGNRNIFKAITHLAMTWCDLFQIEEFDAEQALTESNIKGFMRMLKFAEKPSPENDCGYEWDIRVKGLGLDFWVSEASATFLNSAAINMNTPTVAQQTQGDVIQFAAEALKIMGDDGYVVLFEDYQIIVDYVPTPFRYLLTVSDTTVLGQRRSAKRLAVSLLDHHSTTEIRPSDSTLKNGLSVLLDAMAYDLGVEVPLIDEITMTLALGLPMGVTVREVHQPPSNLTLLVTGVEPDGQAIQKGARIGYFVAAIDGIPVHDLDTVFDILKELKSQSKRSGEGRNYDEGSDGKVVNSGVESFALTLTKAPPVNPNNDSAVFARQAEEKKGGYSDSGEEARQDDDYDSDEMEEEEGGKEKPRPRTRRNPPP